MTKNSLNNKKGAGSVALRLYFTRKYPGLLICTQAHPTLSYVVKKIIKVECAVEFQINILLIALAKSIAQVVRACQHIDHK